MIVIEIALGVALAPFVFLAILWIETEIEIVGRHISSRMRNRTLYRSGRP